MHKNRTPAKLPSFDDIITPDGLVPPEAIARMTCKETNALFTAVWGGRVAAAILRDALTSPRQMFGDQADMSVDVEDYAIACAQAITLVENREDPNGSPSATRDLRNTLDAGYAIGVAAGRMLGRLEGGGL